MVEMVLSRASWMRERGESCQGQQIQRGASQRAQRVAHWDLEMQGDSLSTADILVVDDNPANLVAIETALGELGARVQRAQSGSEALRLLLRHDFAVILLDVKMPTLDGFETARLIRARRRSSHTPIIFVDGSRS